MHWARALLALFCQGTNWRGVKQHLQEFLKPLSPKSEQHQFSPNNYINILLRGFLFMRIYKKITKGEML